MQRTFKSKIGWWYYLILTYCSECLLLAIWYKEGMGMAALFLADLALIQFMLKTEYVITDGTLLLKCWIMPVCRIPVAEITKVEDSHNPLSSYALSLDRLKITYGKRYSLVSPDNKKDFIAELQKYNSDIIYVSRKK